MNNIPLIGHLQVCWSMKEIINLDMEHRIPRKNQSYVDAGHNPDSLSGWCWRDRTMPDFVEIVKKEFPFINHVVPAINRLDPGCYHPWHVDPYGNYLKLAGTIDKVYRVLVMLEDSQPGQYVHVNDNVHHQWAAGDWFAWVGATPHATYNMSTKIRYALQLTGIL